MNIYRKINIKLLMYSHFVEVPTTTPFSIHQTFNISDIHIQMLALFPLFIFIFYGNIFVLLLFIVVIFLVLFYSLREVGFI